MLVTERSTYSFLDILGDVGGLYDALRILGGLLVMPFASKALSNELVKKILSFAMGLIERAQDALQS